VVYLVCLRLGVAKKGLFAMTSPPQKPTLVPFESKRRNDVSFWDFVRAKHLQWVGLPLGGTALLAYVNYARSLSNGFKVPGFGNIDTGFLSVVLYAVIALTLLVLLGVLHKRIPSLPPGQPPETRRAHRAVAQFMAQWKQLWTVWLIFYLAVGFQRFLVVSGTGTLHHLADYANAPLANVALHALNNAQTVVLYLCYHVITWTSLKPSGESGGYEEQTPAHLAWSLLIIVTLVEAGCALVLPETLQAQVQTGFKVLSGFGCGAAMAMVVGRLESKYAGSHPVLVFLFYLYALLQMTFLVFGSSAPAAAGAAAGLPIAAYEQDAVAAIALFLKVVLFAFVYWLIHSNRLLYYMVRIHELNGRVEGDWEQFSRELA
jgi:hypothetical protein